MNQLNPMILAAIGSLLRWALAIGAGYLVRLGVWEAADAEGYVTALAAALALALTSLAWSWYQKYQARKVTLVALALAQVAEQTAADIASGAEAPPVTTPASVVPALAEKSF